MKKYKYLYIPLELFHRELNGVILLSVIAAKSGWTVIFGQKRSLLPIFDVLPRGVFFPKSVVPGEESQFIKLKEYGHKIASVDAEGLITDNGELGVVRRYSQKTVDLSSLLFFWGEEQFNQASNFLENISKKSVISGSPLFDYWRLQKSTYEKNISLNSKKTILIASSFGMVNHITGLGETPHLQISSAGKEVYEKHFNYLRQTIEVKKITFKEFKTIVRELIEFLGDQYNIILRPHPSEDVKEWKKIINNYENITIQTGGSISSLLLNCDILIHSDSTTSIEGFYYGKNIISFVPSELSDEQLKVLNPFILQVSNVCKSAKEIIETLDEISKGKNLKSGFNLNRIIEGSDSSNIAQSSEKIVESLNKIDLESNRNFPSKLKLFFSFNSLISRLKFRVVWFLGWIDYSFGFFDGKYAPSRTRYKYGKTKQDPLDLKTIEKILMGILNAINLDSKSIKISQINKKLFMISSDSRD
jgi:surface carbohydrate biosynthesis protein